MSTNGETPDQVVAGSGNGSRREVETKTTRMPFFYGITGHKDDIAPRALVERIEHYCRTTNKGVNAECHELYLTLRGEPLKWWESFKDSGANINDWDEVKTEFLKDYDYRMTGESSYKLISLKMKAGETVVDFFSRVSAATMDMKRGITEETTADTRAASERMLRHVQKNLFISGLREEIKTRVLNDPPSDLRGTKESARKAEFITKNAGYKPIASVAIMDEVIAALDMALDISPRENDEEELQEEEIAAINNWRRSKGRKPFNRNFKRRTPFQGKCHNCDKVGHFARFCREPKRGVKSLDGERNEDPRDRSSSDFQMATLKNW